MSSDDVDGYVDDRFYRRWWTGVAVISVLTVVGYMLVEGTWMAALVAVGAVVLAVVVAVGGPWVVGWLAEEAWGRLREE